MGDSIELPDIAISGCRDICSARDDLRRRPPRPRGEGSIVRYRSQWRLRIRWRGVEKTWFFPTYAAAETARNEVLIQREQGTPLRRVGTTRPTLNSWLNDYLAQLAMARPRTHRFYSQKLVHVRARLGPIALDELDAEDIRHALSELTESGMSASGVHHVFRSLSAALNAAVRERKIPANPCALVSTPKRAHFEAKTLTAEQCQRLVDSAWDTRVGPLIVLALATGMRAGELLALTWDDIDLVAGLITVTKSVQWHPKGAHRAGQTKTRSSRRTILVSDVAVEALELQRRATVPAKLANPTTLAARLDLVFPGVRGGYTVPSGAFVRDFRRALSQAGCPRVRFHDLRHTTGLLLTRSVGLVVASRMLGHSDPVTTARYYGHAQAEDFTAAANVMGRALRTQEWRSSPAAGTA
jgi:integrase